MDPETGVDPGAVDAQNGEETTRRDPGDEEIRSSEGGGDGRPEEGAREAEAGEPSTGVQRHEETRTRTDGRRKTKKGKTSQSASGNIGCRKF